MPLITLDQKELTALLHGLGMVSAVSPGLAKQKGIVRAVLSRAGGEVMQHPCKTSLQRSVLCLLASSEH